LTVGASLTLTATVAPPTGSTGTPTGAVTFLDGSTTLQTVNVDSTGKATYTTSTLSVGSHSLTAQYGGDSNFASSASSEVSVTVNSPPPADFSLSIGATNATVTNAEPATVSLNVAPVNGFNSTIAFACSGLPAGISCSFNPSAVAPSESTPVSENTLHSTTFTLTYVKVD
jgi:Bacterial Ig-like domain (group 3)